MPQPTALIVDDNADNRAIFKIALETAGYRAVEAGDGFTCLEVLRQGLRFHLMVLDLRMPVMSGLDVLREVRKLPRTEEMHIIVCTGNPDMAVGDEVNERADYVISKPINPVEFSKFTARLQSSARAPMF